MKKDDVKKKPEWKAIGKQIREKTAPVFEKVGNLSKLHRVLICVVTLSLMIGGYYYFFMMPFQEKISTLEQQHQELTQKLALYKNRAARLEEFRRKKQEKEGEFYKALAALPDAKEIPSLLTAVSKSGNDSGLEFLLFKPESESIKDFYSEIPVSINVKGGYHQIAQFFDRVSQLSRIVNIKDIIINYTQGGMLTSSCKAITYRFIEKVDTGTAEQKGKKKRGRDK